MSIERTISRPIPTRLASEPLVDAIFEVRFFFVQPGTLVLPGMLIEALHIDGAPALDRMPISDLPDVARRADPQLRYAPVVRITWGDYFFLIADEALQVACRLPYPGWINFRSMIIRACDAIVSKGVAREIDRWSLKYVDLLPMNDLKAQVNGLEWSLSLGGQPVVDEIIGLRVERRIGSVMHLIGVQTGAAISLVDGRVLSGVALEVDTIELAPVRQPPAFLESLPEAIDSLHLENKRAFFELLKPETEQMLGPVYD